MCSIFLGPFNLVARIPIQPSRAKLFFLLCKNYHNAEICNICFLGTLQANALHLKDIHTLGSIWPGGLSCMKEPFADFFWTWIFKRLKQMCVYVQAAAYCFTGCPIEAYVLIVFAVVDRIVLAWIRQSILFHVLPVLSAGSSQIKSKIVQLMHRQEVYAQ